MRCFRDTIPDPFCALIKAFSLIWVWFGICAWFGVAGVSELLRPFFPNAEIFKSNFAIDFSGKQPPSAPKSGAAPPGSCKLWGCSAFRRDNLAFHCLGRPVLEALLLEVSWTLRCLFICCGTCWWCLSLQFTLSQNRPIPSSEYAGLWFPSRFFSFLFSFRLVEFNLVYLSLVLLSHLASVVATLQRWLDIVFVLGDVLCDLVYLRWFYVVSFPRWPCVASLFGDNFAVADTNMLYLSFRDNFVWWRVKFSHMC